MTSKIDASGVFPYEYQTHVLANGLKVITIPLENPGLVAYFSIVRTGSRDEWEPGHSGFAHFFEHMMFRGTEKYPGPVYDRFMTEMGADANAYTTDDYTCYHIVFNKDYLSRIVELESDRFMNLSYSEEVFKTEAGAVKGEYLKGRSNPWSVLTEKLQDTAFDLHTYKHTTIGFAADIDAMPTMYEYSQSFFQRYYRPENIVIVVAGDIVPDNTIRIIENNYEDWQPGYVDPQITPEPVQQQERLADVSYDGQTLPILTIAYKGPAFTVANNEVAACYLLGNLAFGETSDLYRKLVLQEQKVQFIGTDFGFSRDPKLLEIYAMIKNEADIDGVRDEIYHAVDKFQAMPVAPAKLEAEKSHLKYGFIMSLDTAERVAGRLANLVAITGDVKVVDRLYELIDTLTPAEIQAAAQKYLVPQHRTIIVLKGAQK